MARLKIGKVVISAAPVGTRFASENARRRLTCAAPGTELVETNDPHDRAHLEFGPDGLLLPAARRGGRKIRGRAREYPRSSMTPGGVAFDSVFDATYELERRLDREINGGGEDDSDADTR